MTYTKKNDFFCLKKAEVLHMSKKISNFAAKKVFFNPKNG